MVDFTNLQVYGVPVVTYLLVGITTGVLAYATSIGGIEKLAESAAKSLGEITETPANVLSSVSSSDEKEPEPPEEVTPTPAPPSEEEPKMEGGRKRRRKTPKSRSIKNRKRTKRSHK